MRKGLIATAVAVALFAVGAFAASFAVQSEDIASGSNGVDRCALYVDIEFGDLTPPAGAADDFTVDEATATFYNVESEGVPVPVTTCDGFDATLAVLHNGVTVPEDGLAAISGGTASFEFGSALNVGQITRASVAVEGNFLPSDWVPLVYP